MATVLPISETTPQLDINLGANREADLDDPAIYYNQNNPAKSIVIGTKKNLGLSVYNLDGKEIQSINPGNVRYNNVDIINNFNFDEGQADIAIASDRNNDSLSIFKINPGDQSLTNITSTQLSNANASIFGIDDGDRAAYGLAAYKSPVDGKSYVFVTQNNGNQIAQLQLSEDSAGNVTADVVRTLTIPSGRGQAEGLVIDRDTGTLYVGQENFGIYKFDAEVNGSKEFTVVDSIANGSGQLKSDIEGLSIYYGDNGKGYLIASSQGNNSYATYDRQGNNEFLGSFQIGNNNGIDGVQATDGIDISNRNFGGDFSDGIVVVQDGQNENNTTNFKYVSFKELADANDFIQLGGGSGNAQNPNSDDGSDSDNSNNVANFQLGTNGYNSVEDTVLQENTPNRNNANSNSLDVDANGDQGKVQSLLRFDNIFGNRSGQIPQNAQIVSAQLEVDAFDDGSGLKLHRMLQDWNDNNTWNSLDNGIQTNNIEATADADSVTGTVTTGVVTIDVTNSVQQWQEDPELNYGWAVLPTSNDGIDFGSAESSSPPSLIVEYTIEDSNELSTTNVDFEPDI